MPVISTSTEHPPQRLPQTTEHNMNAQALRPLHNPTLDFFKRSLDSFQSTKNTPFQVICTLTPPRRSGAAALLQHRILATPTASPPRDSPPSRLVIMDSSFNPPTLAHLQMVKDAVLEEFETEKGPGAIRLLLLLAIQNADKAAKPASFDQRLAMMWAFARDIRKSIDEAVQANDEGPDVAVDLGLSTQPYFHAKSATIAQSDFYKAYGAEGDQVDVESKVPEQIILAGYDTLIRIFDPKYYGQSSEDETSMRDSLDPFFKRAKLRVTMRTDEAWGDKAEQSTYVEDLLHGDGLEKVGGSKEWADRIQIVERQTGGESVISSTLAREAAKNQDHKRLEELVPSQVKRWVEMEKLYVEDA